MLDAILEDIPSSVIFDNIYQDDSLYVRSVWLTAHNAFANYEDGWIYAQNSMNLEHMFRHGVRSFMLDVHQHNNDLLLCHGNCEATAVQRIGAPDTFAAWCAQLGQLIINDQNAIVTLHLESHAPSEAIFNVIQETGLRQFILINKNPNDASLTLGEMRANNERVVIFSDYAFERNNQGYPEDNMQGLHPGIYPTLNYKETQFSLDEHPGCEMRADFRANANDPNINLFVFNHFSSISAIKDFNNINKYDAIMKRVIVCLNNNLFPNFIAVDFFERGECTNCISSKNVIFTLNALSNLLQNELNSNNGQDRTVLLPEYSHLRSFFTYLFSPNVINTLLFASVDLLLHKYEQNVINSIELLKGKNSHNHKIIMQTAISKLLPTSAHILLEGSMLYNALSNNYLFATCTAGLLYVLPNIYALKTDSPSISRLIDYRGYIISPILVGYIGYEFFS